MRLLSSLRDGVREIVTPPRGQIPVLDALRTLAVLLVVCGHFNAEGRLAFTDATPALVRSPLFRFGWTGVDLFFILSGFLIGRQLWREVVQTGTVDPVRFVLRRGFRIWPLYYLFALASPALTDTWRYKWPDWVFLSNYLSGRVEGGWSLSTEEQFYIVMPLGILLLAGRMRLRGWLLLIPGLLVAVLSTRYLAARELLAAGMAVSDVKQALYFPFHLRCEGLLVGLFIALVATLRRDWVFAPSRAQMWRTWGVAGLAAAAGAGLHALDDVVFPFTALALIFGGLAVALLADQTGLTRFLSARGFYVVSKLSFGMYLNHFAVLRWITPELNALVRPWAGSGTAGFLVAMAATVACSLAISAALFVAVEHPFLMLRERRLSRRATAAAPVPDPGYSLPRPVAGVVAVEPPSVA